MKGLSESFYFLFSNYPVGFRHLGRQHYYSGSEGNLFSGARVGRLLPSVHERVARHGAEQSPDRSAERKPRRAADYFPPYAHIIFSRKKCTGKTALRNRSRGLRPQKELGNRLHFRPDSAFCGED